MTPASRTIRKSRSWVNRRCLPTFVLTEPPCRRAYIATSCATGMRIGANPLNWPGAFSPTTTAPSSLVSRSSFPLMGGFQWRMTAFPFKIADAVPLRNFRRNIPPARKMSLTFTASMILRFTISTSPAVRNRTRLSAAWAICGATLAAVSSFIQHGGPTSKTH